MEDSERMMVESEVATLINKLIGKDGQLVDHVLIVYTVNTENNEDALGMISTGYVPRWLAKGMLVDALDMITEVS